VKPQTDHTQPGSMRAWQRWGGLYVTVLMLLLLAFFAYHQWKNTGFFTAKFGLVEMVALYLPIIISLVPPLMRAIQGRRNPSRPVEAASDVFLAIGSIWLRHSFPFDFAHLADPFPASWHFAFAWLTNDVGRFILLLQIVVGFVSALAITATYYSTHREEREATRTGQQRKDNP
jgi:hypothetical protein